ncbi:hypothetical protein BDU57DRAFT_274055 [Ampelomyces quisqualis]|uniref:Uncharacterized protein n=1 Tax=Ampelomyces quisqualis TaxID=50730 RepID=A0A6A5QKU8_AMPQU|nr:hypothetical protein BDU57DRAFT_274055 [Ampelomyces quisqualis]
MRIDCHGIARLSSCHLASPPSQTAILQGCMFMRYCQIQDERLPVPMPEDFCASTMSFSICANTVSSLRQPYHKLFCVSDIPSWKPYVTQKGLPSRSDSDAKIHHHLHHGQEQHLSHIGVSYLLSFICLPISPSSHPFLSVRNGALRVVFFAGCWW